MYCVRLETGRRAGWGTMCLREVVGKIVGTGVIGLLTLGIASTILCFRLLWNETRQELWDSLAGTVVARG
jgi:uncharacterized RDD family membrane protein YckC